MKIQPTSPRFGHIEILESDYNSTYDSAKLYLQLDVKDFQGLMPRHLQQARDFELTIDRQDGLQLQTFFPGAGNPTKVTMEEMLPLLRKLCSENASREVVILGIKKAYGHIENALKRFDKALTAFGHKQAEAGKPKK